MNTKNTTIFIIDDDDQVRGALSLLMESVGWQVKTFANPIDYLEQFDQTIPGCLVTDIRMPMMSGLDLQLKLKEYKISLPVLMITGHGDVSMAVRALKEGAFDFIEKPFNNQYMLDKVHQAIALDVKNREAISKSDDIYQMYAQLTDKEKQVFELIVTGAPNKQIAQKVCVTQSAVEARRAKIMEKMNAENLTDLVKMAVTIGMLGI